MILICLSLLAGCQSKSNVSSLNGARSSGSWAYEKMISLNGVSYVVTTEKTEKIYKKIGEVKNYSTNENDFNKDNFSNYFKVGTKLYSIQDTNIKDAIAVETDNQHLYKAVNTVLLNR